MQVDVGLLSLAFNCEPTFNKFIKIFPPIISRETGGVTAKFLDEWSRWMFAVDCPILALCVLAATDFRSDFIISVVTRFFLSQQEVNVLII